MYKDLENEKYDFLVLGTSLTETSLSAYLAKTKKKLIQIDISKSYGGDCKNFNLRDMEKFMNEVKEDSSKDSSIKNISFIDRKVKEDLEPVAEKENFRQYNFDLNPKFIYAKSKSSSELIDSKASNYIEFNSVRKIFFMFNDQFLNVPFSKSEIFISNDLDLLEKQKLLNFIFSVMKLKNNNVDVNSTVDIKKDIELDDDFLFNEIKKNLQTKAIDFLKKNFNEKINDMILLILANQTLNSQNMTVDQICDKIYKFLISVQIYDKTPFLIPLYGSSEFAQAMSRLSAVNGSIFLINDLLSCNINYNKEYNKDDKDSRRFLVEINDEEKKEKFKINVDKIIVNNCYLDDNKSQIKFSEDIKIKNNSNDFVYKYCAFFIIKSITELSSFKDGPFYYRVPKNNTFLKNEYQLDAIRYFNNTSVIPNNRMMIQISIMSNLNEKDKDEFIKKAKDISVNFIKKIVDDLKEDILKNYNNEEFKKNCKFNRIRIIEEINEEMIENIFNIIPNVSDKILDYIQEKTEICELIDTTFNDKRKYDSKIPSSLLLLSGIQSRMKQQFSISEVPLALTSKKVIEKLNLNVSYNINDTLLKESNINEFKEAFHLRIKYFNDNMQKELKVKMNNLLSILDMFFKSDFEKRKKSSKEVEKFIKNIDNEKNRIQNLYEENEKKIEKIGRASCRERV